METTTTTTTTTTIMKTKEADILESETPKNDDTVKIDDEITRNIKKNIPTNFCLEETVMHKAYPTK